MSCPAGFRCLPGAAFPTSTKAVPSKITPSTTNAFLVQFDRRREYMNGAIFNLVISGAAVFGVIALFTTIYFKVECIRNRCQCFTSLLRFNWYTSLFESMFREYVCLCLFLQLIVRVFVLYIYISTTSDLLL